MKNTGTPALRTLLTLCLLSALSACNFAKEKATHEVAAPAPTAESVLEQAIQKAGTLEKWKNMASLAYTKKSRLLLENGDIESEVTQRHHYDLRPNKRITIAWAVETDSFLIVHTDSLTQKFKNGQLIDEGASVQTTVNSATYVIGMPFKLLDKGTVLRYDGLQSLNAIDTVRTINASYAPEKHQNHSTQDEWWYHFDKNNGAFLSSMVYHEPTYALIENIATEQVDGLTFPKRRMSYRCDAEGKKQFLRAEFWYTDYAVTFLKN